LEHYYLGKMQLQNILFRNRFGGIGIWVGIGATSLSIMILSIRTLSIRTLSVMALTIMTLSIMTFSLIMNKTQHSA